MNSVGGFAIVTWPLALENRVPRHDTMSFTQPMAPPSHGDGVVSYVFTKYAAIRNSMLTLAISRETLRNIVILLQSNLIAVLQAANFTDGRLNLPHLRNVSDMSRTNYPDTMFQVA